MFYNIDAYDILYSEFEEVCRKAWCEKSNYLFIDLNKKRKESKYPIFNERKNPYIECIQETETSL